VEREAGLRAGSPPRTPRCRRQVVRRSPATSTTCRPPSCRRPPGGSGR
jgi:hypothetical protein